MSTGSEAGISVVYLNQQITESNGGGYKSYLPTMHADRSHKADNLKGKQTINNGKAKKEFDALISCVCVFLEDCYQKALGGKKTFKPSTQHDRVG
jgi:hypothetical protein